MFENIKNYPPCKGCAYWRPIVNGGFDRTLFYCCHHILDTGRSRPRDGDKCLGYSFKSRKVFKGFDVPLGQR